MGIYAQRSSTYGGSSSSNQYPQGWQKEQRQAEFSTAISPKWIGVLEFGCGFSLFSSAERRRRRKKERRKSINHLPTPSIYAQRSSTYGGSSSSNQYPQGWQKEQRQAEFSTAIAPKWIGVLEFGCGF